MAAVQHIAFNCSDLKRMEAFYVKHFGFKRVRTFNRGKPDEFIMLRMKSVCLELFQASAGSMPAVATDAAPGFKHLAFEVDDLDVAIKSLQEDGIKTDPIYDCSAIVPGMRVCFFVDPNGTRLELMQGYQDEKNS